MDNKTQPIDGLTRVNFFAGQLLTADDLQTEQDYVREKHRRHNRMLLGAGIVTGLHVTLDPSSSEAEPVVSVDGGYAIAPDGEELSVSAARVCAFCVTASSGYVTLQYAERIVAADPTSTDVDEFRASRIREGALVAFAERVPDTAIALARLEREGGAWRLVDAFQPPRARRDQ